MNDLNGSRGMRLIAGNSNHTLANAIAAYLNLSPVKADVRRFSDDEVFAAQRLLAHKEGIYCEPVGATAFAGWLRAVKQGTVAEGERSICLVTGHGFKDPDSVERLAGANPSLTIEAPKLAETIRRLVS